VVIFACRWCNEWVQVAYHGTQVVLGRNWPTVIFKYDLKRNDFLEFKINAFNPKVKIYKHNSSNPNTNICPDHS
jgi:hypothetical protein